MCVCMRVCVWTPTNPRPLFPFLSSSLSSVSLLWSLVFHFSTHTPFSFDKTFWRQLSFPLVCSLFSILFLLRFPSFGPRMKHEAVQHLNAYPHRSEHHASTPPSSEPHSYSSTPLTHSLLYPYSSSTPHPFIAFFFTLHPLHSPYSWTQPLHSLTLTLQRLTLQNLTLSLQRLLFIPSKPRPFKASSLQRLACSFRLPP